MLEQNPIVKAPYCALGLIALYREEKQNLQFSEQPEKSVVCALFLFPNPGISRQFYIQLRRPIHLGLSVSHVLEIVQPPLGSADGVSGPVRFFARSGRGSSGGVMVSTEQGV